MNTKHTANPHIGIKITVITVLIILLSTSAQAAEYKAYLLSDISGFGDAALSPAYHFRGLHSTDNAESNQTKVFGFTEVPFYVASNNISTARSMESNYGNFCADAVYHFFDSQDNKIDAVIINGGALRANLDGQITAEAVQKVYPYEDKLCLIDATGKQILDALEWGTRSVGRSLGIGGFPQVSGIKFTVDATIEPSVQSKNDAGEIWNGSPLGIYRVKDVQIKDRITGVYEPLELTKHYIVGGMNYLLLQHGDGYEMFTGRTIVEDAGVDYLSLLNFIASFPTDESHGYPTLKLGMGYDDVDDRITILYPTNPLWDDSDAWTSHYDKAFYQMLVETYADSFWTEDTALKIKTASELAALARFAAEDVSRDFYGKYISLEENLDIGLYEWYPLFLSKTAAHQHTTAPMCVFAGNFQGNGHCITGLRIQQTNCSILGLFGYTSGIISDLIVSGRISGYWNLGGVAAFNYGTIDGCTSHVSVQAGGLCAGGVVGQNTSGNIVNSKSTKLIVGITHDTGNIGGIVGWNGKGHVTKCDNSASVTGGTALAG